MGIFAIIRDTCLFTLRGMGYFGILYPLYTPQCNMTTILTSTKNASLIMPYFLAMIIKMNSHVLLLYVETMRCWKMTLI